MLLYFLEIVPEENFQLLNIFRTLTFIKAVQYNPGFADIFRMYKNDDCF